jgi:hypothetical protein
LIWVKFKKKNCIFSNNFELFQFFIANLNVVYQLGDHNHDPLSPKEIQAKKSACFKIFGMTKEYRKELLNNKEKKK